MHKNTPKINLKLPKIQPSTPKTFSDYIPVLDLDCPSVSLLDGPHVDKGFKSLAGARPGLL